MGARTVMRAWPGSTKFIALWWTSTSSLCMRGCRDGTARMVKAVATKLALAGSMGTAPRPHGPPLSHALMPMPLRTAEIVGAGTVAKSSIVAGSSEVSAAMLMVEWWTSEVSQTWLKRLKINSGMYLHVL